MSLKQNASQCTIPKTSDNIYINEAVEIKRVNMKDDRYTEKYKKLTNKQSSGTKQTTIDAQARDWFRSLSAEERSGATRFSDRAFLGTFLALSSPWLTSTTTKATGTTTNTTNDNHVTRSGEYIFLCTFYVIYPGILFSIWRLTDGIRRVEDVSCPQYVLEQHQDCSTFDTPFFSPVRTFLINHRRHIYSLGYDGFAGRIS